MKKKIFSFPVALVMLGIAEMANATLTTIGTATYDRDGAGGANPVGTFKLIWDDDNNGNSVVWLDYSNSLANWSSQKSWAASLGSALTVNLYDQYSVVWENDWRLPTTVDGPWVYGTDGTATGGYNITSSEMGHLYYEELGNKGLYSIAGSYQDDHGLKNKGEFENLVSYAYWSSTEYSTNTAHAWFFNMTLGYQGDPLRIDKQWSIYGLALRSGQVSTAPDPVPEPTTMILFGTGLAGLIAARRRKKAC